MANHKSAKKRIRQSAKRNISNNYYHKTARNAIRKLRSLTDKKEASKFLLRVKGDGNTYKFRLTMKGSYANYSANFKTIKGQWVDIEIPVENFQPYYFGRSIRAPKLKVQKVNSMGILISDKQEGNFLLEIEHIKAF